jgi:hypothetical protein
MTKIKHEAELAKLAVKVGMNYAQRRGAAQFEPTDSADLKIEYVYKLLVHDKLVQPLAKSDLSIPNMRHKLALWISRQLPPDHPLLQ